MKARKSLKKLDLNKEKISAITADEAKNVNGGLFRSHFVCTQTKADVGCTSHTRCSGGSDGGGVTILCID